MYHEVIRKQPSEWEYELNRFGYEDRRYGYIIRRFCTPKYFRNVIREFFEKSRELPPEKRPYINIQMPKMLYEGCKADSWKTTGEDKEIFGCTQAELGTRDFPVDEIEGALLPEE